MKGAGGCEERNLLQGSAGQRGGCCEGQVSRILGGLMVGVLHLPELVEPSCLFHAVGTQTRMSNGGVGEAVGELPLPSCITAGGQGTRGQGEGSPWLWGLGKPLQAVWE